MYDIATHVDNRNKYSKYNISCNISNISSDNQIQLGIWAIPPRPITSWFTMLWKYCKFDL